MLVMLDLPIMWAMYGGYGEADTKERSWECCGTGSSSADDHDAVVASAHARLEDALGL